MNEGSEGGLVLWDVVEEHLDEATFLLGMWRERQHAPHYTFRELCNGPEARLLAHIDGLVAGEQEVRDALLWPTIEQEKEDPARVSAAGLALLSMSNVSSAFERYFGLLREADALQRSALAEALCLVDRPEVPERVLRELSRDNPPMVLAELLRVAAVYRADVGSRLPGWLSHEMPEIQAHALATAAAGGRRDCLAHCERLLEASTERVAQAALEAALVLGSTAAWQLCARSASTSNPDALLYLGLLGGPEQHRLLRDQLYTTTNPAALLWAIGFAGRGEHATAALRFLDAADEHVAKLAGEAFVAITGYAAPPEANPEPPTALDAALSDADEVAFEDDDLDADLVPNLASELPLLGAGAARAWWREHESRFMHGRFVAGEVLGPASVYGALTSGSARRRHPWCTALRIASGALIQIASGAFSARQERDLASFRACNPALWSSLLR